MNHDFHRTPEAMARTLVQYISCDRRVRSEVQANFLTRMSLGHIAEIRASWERPLNHIEPYKVHEGYSPSQASDALARANVLFVQAMWREQEAMEKRQALREIAG